VKTSLSCSISLLLLLAATGFGQSSATQAKTEATGAAQPTKKHNGPGTELGQGGKDIGKGAAKGSADLAKGTAGGAGELVTGHPASAAVSTGKGAVGFGKNVSVGTGKGTVKIGKGLGGAFKKLGRKSAHKDSDNR
jgi:hypothetical protein